MKNSVLDKLKSYFDEYYFGRDQTYCQKLVPYRRFHTDVEYLPFCTFAHRHVLSKLSNTSLKAYCYALKID